MGLEGRLGLFNPKTCGEAREVQPGETRKASQERVCEGLTEKGLAGAE